MIDAGVLAAAKAAPLARSVARRIPLKTATGRSRGDATMFLMVMVLDFAVCAAGLQLPDIPRTRKRLGSKTLHRSLPNSLF
jgi:hypothetical protein